MTIKVKQPTGVIDVLTTDTVILTVAGKVGIEAMNCLNDTAADVIISFYISTDATSVSGKRVSGPLTLSAGEDIDINAIIGQGYLLGNNIIAVADLVGINCSTTYTQYTGGDI